MPHAGTCTKSSCSRFAALAVAADYDDYLAICLLCRQNARAPSALLLPCRSRGRRSPTTATAIGGPRQHPLDVTHDLSPSCTPCPARPSPFATPRAAPRSAPGSPRLPPLPLLPRSPQVGTSGSQQPSPHHAEVPSLMQCQVLPAGKDTGFLKYTKVRWQQCSTLAMPHACVSRPRHSLQGDDCARTALVARIALPHVSAVVASRPARKLPITVPALSRRCGSPALGPPALRRPSLSRVLVELRHVHATRARHSLREVHTHHALERKGSRRIPSSAPTPRLRRNCGCGRSGGRRGCVVRREYRPQEGIDLSLGCADVGLSGRG